MCSWVIIIQGNRASIFSFGLRPLPRELIGQTRGSMSFRQRIINLQSPIHRRPGFWHRLARRNTDVLLDEEISISEAGITEGEVWIAGDRLLKLRDRCFDCIGSAVV